MPESEIPRVLPKVVTIDCLKINFDYLLCTIWIRFSSVQNSVFEIQLKIAWNSDNLSANDVYGLAP